MWCYYGERLPVVSIDNRPGIKVRENRLFKFCIIKSEKVAHVSCIVKRHLATTVVQEDPHPPGRFGWINQAVLWVGACFIFTGAIAVVPQHQGPEAVIWAQADLLLPVDGSHGHTQAPRSLGAHLHLPVVSARGKGLRAQHDVVASEALWVVGQVGLDFADLDTGATRRNPQAGVGRVWVKGHRGNRWKAKEGVRNGPTVQQRCTNSELPKTLWQRPSAISVRRAW